MQWYMKPIPCYMGVYSASSDGRIYSHSRVDARGHKRNGRWLNPVLDKDGYPRVHLCVNNIKRKFQVHRLVAMAFLSNESMKPSVNHIDGIKSNNSKENLEWATVKENIDHAIKFGLIVNHRDAASGRFISEEK